MTEPTPADLERRPAARGVRAAGELVLGLLAFATAWPFGSVDAFWEAIATAGVALLTLLWAVHSSLTRRLRLRFDAPALILAGLILLSGVQLVPLPTGLVRLASPSTVHWHETMRPASAEVLLGEPAAVARPTWIPISLDPTATRLFACRIAALLAVYLAARNWLASRAAFRRLAWAALANGVALAAFALGQYFSSPPNVVYWSVPTAGAVFGPFVCRNHYPDYIALCAGLALGIMVTNRKPPTEYQRGEAEIATVWDDLGAMIGAPLQLLQQPAIVAAAAAVGLMLVSIPFSLSRGGMLSFLSALLGTFFLARMRTGGTGGDNRLPVTFAAAVAFAAVVWFGYQPIEKRLEEIGNAKTIDDRTPLWRSTLKQVPGFWLGGAGNGTHLRIEPLGRDAGPSNSLAEHAHNEFVEAAVEGGLPRSALTLALPAIILIATARGFRRQRVRSAGPLLLGSWFGLAVVAVHACTDFALHIPAVALLAIAVAAFAMAAARDGDFQVIKQRRRKSEPEAPPTGVRPSRSQWGGGTAVAVSVSLAAGMLLLAWDARQRFLGDRYLSAAAARGRSAPEQRIEWLRASVAADPRNPDAFFQLAQAHLDAAQEDDPLPAEALAGAILPRRARADRYTLGTLEAHILPALRALRTARDLCPLIPEVHARLGVLTEYCAHAEPALVHLERAKLILKTDSEIWYACGAEAARTGDRERALANWKESLRLSPKQLKPILRAARLTLTPEEMLGTLLPDDPAVLVGAADDLYPDRRAQRAQRVPFLQKAAAAEHLNSGVPEWTAIAKARAELGRIEEARAAWEKAIDLEPDRAETRNGLARMLEAEELYAEAIPHLEWLSYRNANDADLKTRLLAARHGAKLNREIGK